MAFSVRPLIKRTLPPRIQIALRNSRIWPVGLRLLTGRIRLLPDFIIIGAQRCGTASLYNYLIEHLCIFPALIKEVHFFDKNFKKGVTWYRAHFPSYLYKSFIKQTRRQEFITGEASPYYIFHPAAPGRIAALVPEVKLIALLRNPIDRAYSHYQREKRIGRENLSFEDAIQREEERIREERKRMLEDNNYYSFRHHRFSYLSRGIYVDQLKAWMNVFPRSQFLILNSEDFFAEPGSTVKQVLEFLKLPHLELTEYKKYHVAHYQTMGDATRRSLMDYFEPHNKRLYECLGTSFDWDT